VPPIQAPGATQLAAIADVQTKVATLAAIETQITVFIIPALQAIQAKPGGGTAIDLQPVLDALKALTLKAA
jgi:hypothetical protein